MKPIGKQSLLVTVVIILIALNLGVVAFMWYTQRPNNEGPANTRFLIERLNFSKEQEQQYLDLQRRLADSLEPVKEHERKVHDRFFEMMHAEAPDSAQVAATIDTMGHIRGQIEYFTFMHFRQVRAMCTPEQKTKFDATISEAMRRMAPPPLRRPGGPQGYRNSPPPPPNGPPQQ